MGLGGYDFFGEFGSLVVMVTEALGTQNACRRSWIITY
jgi:hypothetical protein